MTEQRKTTVQITTDPLIAPLRDIHCLFLKVYFPDGSMLGTGVREIQIEQAIEYCADRGIDLMPLLIAEITYHVESPSSYRLRMPDNLVAMMDRPASMVAAE